MKRVLPVFLAAALLLAACGVKTGSEPEESTTISETEKEKKKSKKETTEAETEEETKESEKVTYVGDGSMPIIEVGGQRYFDFSSEDFLKKLNAKAKEVMNEPAQFQVSEELSSGDEVTLEGDNGLLCVLEMDESGKRIVQVSVMGEQSEDSKLSDIAIAATPVFLLLDPNMEARDAGMHLADIGLAAQLSLTDAASDYEGVHEGIQERVYGEESFIIFNFAPAGAAEEKEEPVSSVPVGEKPDFGPLSDDLYSFQMQVNDDVYQFPMTFAQFTAFGWKYDGDVNEAISAGRYTTSQEFTNGKLKCYAGIANFDVNSIPVSECYVVSMKFDEYMTKDTEVTVTLPGGITLGGDYDAAIQLYGTPGYEYDNETSRRSATYSLSSYQEVEIGSVFDNREIIGSIEVQNVTKPEDFVAGAISDAVPAVVEKYQTPAGFSDKYEDFIIEYGSDLYQLPAPVSVFVSNGWKIVEDSSETTISGKDSSWVTLMKDNQKLKVLARNYDENATAITNGFITNVVSDVYSSKTAIRIAGDISVGMAQADVESKLSGVEHEVDDSGSFIYYKINPTASKMDEYSISVSKETGLVTSITVRHEPKFSDYVNR